MNFRKFLTDSIALINALLAGKDLVGDTRTKYTGIRDQYQTALNSLPAGDGAVDSAVVDRIIEVVSSSMVTMNSAVSGVAAAVNESWNGRVTAGELIPKDRHTAMLGEAAEAARAAGLKQGRTDAETELKTKLEAEQAVAARAIDIVQNGLPPAPDDVLRLDQAAYDARKKDATTRLAEAKERGIDLNLKFVARYAWASPEDATMFADVLRIPGGAPNPLAGGGKKSDTGDTTTVVY